MLQRNGSYGYYHNPTPYSYGVALPRQDQAKPYVFGESSIQPFRSFGITPPPPAPTNSENSIFFGGATTQPTPKFGITPPVFPVERTQVNVPPSIPTLPVPQYNVPNQPLQYPETYNAGDFPIPQRPNNPITYAPGTYPQPSNQPLPVPNFPVPTAPNNPITYFPGTYPQPMPRSASEVDGVIGDMNTSMMVLPQLEALANQQTAQQAIQQNYYQQSQASLMAYNNNPMMQMPPMPNQAIPANTSSNNTSRSQSGGDVFKNALQHTLKVEGGFSNNPNDKGGATMKGVTQATYNSYLKRKGQASRPVKNITQAEVEDIYYQDYWVASGASELAKQDKALAVIHFDTAVNMGVGKAKELLGKSGNNASTYLSVREQQYRQFASKGNQKVFLQGWLNRNNSLRDFITTV